MPRRAPLITSTANPAVKAARRLATRKGRRDEGAFLVEGPQAVAEGLAHLDDLYVAESAERLHADLLAAAADHGVAVRTVTDEVLHALSDTVTPQGVVGVARLPEASLASVLPTARFLVVLDGIADPGNAGTIVRTADAAGADAVVFTAGSVDPFNPKAVRASTGSVFHLPVITGATPDDLQAIRAAGLQVVCADVHAATPIAALDLARPTALLFGGEAAGLSAAAKAACSVAAHIPIAQSRRPGYRGHAESLNLAAAVAVLAYAVATAQAAPRGAPAGTG